MKIELPDDTPIIEIMKFGAALGLDAQKISTDGIRFVKPPPPPDNVRRFPRQAAMRLNSNGNGPEAA